MVAERPVRKKVPAKHREEETALFRRASQLDEHGRSLLGPVGRSWLGRTGGRGKGLNRALIVLDAARIGRDAGEDDGPILAAIGQADQIRWEIVTRNEAFLNFFFSKARIRGGPSFERDDVLQVMRIGLFEAARRFDPERGLSFRTYAAWWVKAKALDHLSETTFQIPRGKVALKIRILNTTREFRVRHQGREPTVTELAELCGSDPETVQSLLLTDGRLCSIDNPVEAPDQNRANRPVSLADALVDPDSVVEARDLAIDCSLVGLALDSLPPHRASVLRALYGIGSPSGEGLTSQALADRMGTSRSGIYSQHQAAVAELSERMGGPVRLKHR